MAVSLCNIIILVVHLMIKGGVTKLHADEPVELKKVTFHKSRKNNGEILFEAMEGIITII